jgi:hypothetical protein
MLADTAAPATEQRRGPSRIKLAAFALICTAAGAVAAYYIIDARNDAKSAERALDAIPVAPAASIAAVQEQPHALTLEAGAFEKGRVALRPTLPNAAPVFTGLECSRVYFAAGSGLCLGSNGILGGAFSFDANMNVTHRIDINGIPSRVRISPDGRYGSMTVFVSGHSYMEAGMSTRTAIVDIASGEFALENLEDLSIYKDGREIDAIDFNFWGVTFERDSNRFYATLQTGGEQYLIHGDITAKRADVLKSNVECPSLSPDGTRIAYKKRVKSGLFGQEWRLQVLDLATMTERSVAETRNIDDQVEWLDGHNLLYYMPDDVPPTTQRPDVWITNVDSNAAPQLYYPGASSPSVVRK